MGFSWTCSKCGKIITADGVTYNAMINVTPTYLETTQINLCESCAKSFNEWLRDKPHSGRYKCSYADESSVFSDKMERRTLIDVSRSDKVIIGDVYPLPASNLTDKEFPKKVLEEAAEVYSAWENYQALEYPCDEEDEAESLYRIIEECCDVIQTASNLIWAAGKEVDLLRFGQSHADKTNRVDVEPILREIMMRNVKKGRYDV